MNALRSDLARCLEFFGSERWRERKDAARDLLAAVREQPPAPDQLAILVEQLLDGLVTPDSVARRSVCHEVLTGIGPSVVPAIRRRLRVGGAGARMIVDLLGDVGGADDVPLLAAILGAPGDDNVRASAAAALGVLGGAEAERALTNVLSDSSEMLRMFALDALARLGTVMPPARLGPLLADPVTRRAAVAVLGHSGDPAAASQLVRFLGDAMPGVRAAAAVAVVRLHAALSVRGDPVAVAAALATGDGEPLRQRIRELVEHRQLEVKLAALALAGALGDVRSLSHVLRAMSDPELRERAVEFAAGLGEAAVPVLVDMVEQSAPETLGDLFLLVSGLGPAGAHPRLIEALTTALEGPDGHAACMAATALGKVGGTEVIAPLARALALEGPAGEAAAVAFAAVAGRALGSRHARVAPHLPADAGGGALVRNLCRAFGLLGRGGDVGFVGPLIARLGDRDVGVRLLAARALGQIGGEHEGAAALALALQDEDAGVRAAACRSLGQLGAAESVPALLTASRDSSSSVRAAAVQALVGLDNPIALARLREVVLADHAPAVVIQAIAGLSRSGTDQDLVMLMSLCRAPDHEIVKAAARGLAGCRGHRATAAVLGLLEHPRWDVRWAAAEALGERGDPTALPPLRRVHAVEPDPLVRKVLAGAVARIEAQAAERAASDGEGAPTA
ncbi:HEAT repeat domain-containing protein [Nannocystis sp. ILAH1]|uniref:HEAT repeat domain-containing protein n=1 Tax=unclassified Nannocystis TaxID=2627009 RepID=UPI00226F488F|nr:MULTISPECIES: HEAT repeat domain-containing protein [unclassified Nannocystis]MCY0986039.1 HEAT repeat domain-containing protein [Nannocystis sp. ILAH1]MCY1068635.1 HEAT repeat domain-containing protein [Nannocystis sp. RBIL2]